MDESINKWVRERMENGTDDREFFDRPEPREYDWPNNVPMII